MAGSTRRTRVAAGLTLFVAMTGVAAAQDSGLLDRAAEDEAARTSTIVWIGDTAAAGPDRPLIRMARDDGYEVRLVADDDLVASEAEAADALDGADLAVVGSTADATLVASLRTSDLPLLALTPNVYVDLGLARSAGVAATATTELRIRPDVFGHPLLAGLIYEPQIFREPATLNTGAPGGGAIVLAREGGTRRPSLFAYESGAPLVDGTAAPAARVAFPFGPDGAPLLTRAGRNLFAAALSWLAEQNVVTIQLVAINDLHGQLEGVGRVRDSDGDLVRAGGAAQLGGLVAERREENPNTLFLSAGALIGESSTLSAAGAEEATVAAFDAMGLDLAVVGTGELSLGRAELERLAGEAQFHFLAANLLDGATDEPLFPAYATQNFAGVDVAVIGIVPTDIADQLPTGSLDGLRIEDELDTINGLVDHLKNDAGVEIVIVAIHQGGGPSADPTQCPGLTGAIGDIVAQASSRVDAYVTGRSQASVCDFSGRPVTVSRPYGRATTVVELRFDRRSGLLETSADNLPVTARQTPEPAVARAVDVYRETLAPQLGAVVGSVADDITRERNLAGEAALGSVVADARLDATSDPEAGGAQLAVVASNRVRAELLRLPSGDERPGRVTLAEAGAVVALNDRLVTVSLTGAQIETLLEQQWTTSSPGVNRMLQVSRDFNYVYNPLAPLGDRVDPTAMTLDGVPVDPAASYRVTVDRSLLEQGSTVLHEATEPIVGPTDRDALLAYLDANRHLSRPVSGRILALATPS